MSDPTEPSMKSAAMAAEDFHFGAAVWSSDGVHVGKLCRVIVDEESLDVHAIVVEETRRFSGHYLGARYLLEDDLAVALEYVAEAGRDRIDLNISTQEVRHLPPYLTYEYPDVTGPDVMQVAMAISAGYAPNLVEAHHKALSELEIRQGEQVMIGHTGEKLGEVADILLEGGGLIGVVVRSARFFGPDEVLLQVRFLGRSDDAALFADLTLDQLETLTPFHPDHD